jgi:hypothetical protein
MGSNVASGEYAGHVRPAVFVHEHAVIYGYTTAAEELDIRYCSCRHQQPGAVRMHSDPALMGADSLHPLPRAQPDPG